MAEVEQLLRNGELDEALTQLKGEVRRYPADAKRRIFLFQLLVVMGEWERALNQLNVLADLDASSLMMVHTYREAIQCEVLRQRVFRGELTPLVFGDPDRWVALMLEALRLTVVREFAQAHVLRDDALALAPAVAGKVGGENFAWIADADMRLGPIIEIILKGAYYWVPFGRIARITIAKPEDLRDLVWMPAEIRWTNGGEAVGLIPTRYPGTETNQDAQLRLARMTLWEELAKGFFVGVGQRMLATDVGDYPLLNVRSIDFLAAPESSAVSAPEAIGND
ncbi:MAG: virulence protein SciE type [Rhodospirillales bacterium]|nr:virulence protein SciE type [Rhodospirillales bacterium]